MPADDTTLDPKKVLLPSAVLAAGRHYTGGVLWIAPKKPVDEEIIYRELRALDIRISPGKAVDNGFWFVFEPQKQITMAQLVLVGAAHNGVFGAWEYLPASEESLDFKEWAEDVRASAKHGISFVTDHWLAIVLVLMGLLGLIIWAILRK